MFNMDSQSTDLGNDGFHLHLPVKNEMLQSTALPINNQKCAITRFWFVPIQAYPRYLPDDKFLRQQVLKLSTQR